MFCLHNKTGEVHMVQNVFQDVEMIILILAGILIHAGPIQYKDVILPVQEIPLRRLDGRQIMLSPQCDFVFW